MCWGVRMRVSLSLRMGVTVSGFLCQAYCHGMAEWLAMAGATLVSRLLADSNRLWTIGLARDHANFTCHSMHTHDIHV